MVQLWLLKLSACLPDGIVLKKSSVLFELLKHGNDIHSHLNFVLLNYLIFKKKKCYMIKRK